jgi:hypothetical protein
MVPPDDMQFLAQRLRQPDAARLLRKGFDLADWASESDNWVLRDGPDAILLEGDNGCVYNLHWLLASRGRSAFLAAERLLGRAFNERNALILFGYTPVEMKAARWFNRKIGAISTGLVRMDNILFEGFYMTPELYEANRCRFSPARNPATRPSSCFAAICPP